MPTSPTTKPRGSFEEASGVPAAKVLNTADNQGKLNPELALLKDSKTLSELRQLYLSSQSPQYAWNHEEGESGEVKLGFSSGLLAGLLLAALVLV